jgi:hypothetical protein
MSSCIRKKGVPAFERKEFLHSKERSSCIRKTGVPAIEKRSFYIRKKRISTAGRRDFQK